LLIGCVLLAIAGCRSQRRETIVVGSKNFTEQIVLAELFAQQIEAHSTLHVERRVNLGGTLLCHQALVAGKIDLYPEYTGTALTAVLHEPPQTDPSAVFHRVQDQYRARFSVEVMPPLGFNNTFAMVVRGTMPRSSTFIQFQISGHLPPNGGQGLATNSWSVRTDIAAGWRRTGCILRASRTSLTWDCSIARSRTGKWISSRGI